MNVANSLPRRWPALACAALVIVAYARAPFGGFVWDDVHLILRDPRLQSWSNFIDVVTSSFWSGSPLAINEFYAAVYRPVVSAAYLAEMQFFGANAIAFHIVNIVLHVVCTILCVRWIAQRIPSAPSVALFFGGMLFAVHPSRVEAVAWISGCVDVWMVFWILLGLEAWQARRNALAGVLFALALFSKEVAVVVPMLLLTDHLLLERDARFWRHWSVTTGIVATAFAIRLLVVPPAAVGGPDWIEMPERVLSTVGFFVQRMVFPWPQTVHPAARAYDAAGNEFFSPWAIALGVVALFSFAGLLISAWKNPKSRAWLADGLWFLVPLVPTLNILDIDTVARASDRFLYWPLIGVCALLTRMIAVTTAHAEWARRAAVVAAATTSIMYVGATALHVSHFRTDYTLWGHEYEVDQSNTEALWALAGIAKYEGLSESAHALCTEGFRAAEARHYRWTSIRFALCQLETSLDLAIPSDPETIIYVREVYDELMDKSLLLADRGSLKFDIHITSKIITARLMANPESVALPRARAHLASGNIDQAIAQLEQITRSYPTSRTGWQMLVNAYRTKGDLDRAASAETRARLLFGEEQER